MRLGSFNLRKIKQRDLAIIAIVLSIVGGLLWYFYMYRPTQDRIAQLESDISLLDIEIRRGEDALQVASMLSEAFAPELLLGQLFALDHRAHRSVEDQDALAEVGDDGVTHGFQLYVLRGPARRGPR